MNETLKHMMANPVTACGAIFLISAIALMTALLAEYAFDLQPCILCIYQRWPYGIAMILSIVGLGTLYEENWIRFCSPAVFLCAVVFFINGLIASYHIGIEQHWWTSAIEGCAVDFAPGSVEELMAMMDNKPAVRCDEIAWADPVLGLSMTVYNMMLSFTLAVGSAFSAVYIQRKLNGIL